MIAHMLSLCSDDAASELTGRTEGERGDVDRWVALADKIDCMAHPWRLLSFSGQAACDQERDVHIEELSQYLLAIEGALTETGSTTFMVGDRVTLAGTHFAVAGRLAWSVYPGAGDDDADALYPLL